MNATGRAGDGVLGGLQRGVAPGFEHPANALAASVVEQGRRREQSPEARVLVGVLPGPVEPIEQGGNLKQLRSRSGKPSVKGGRSRVGRGGGHGSG